MYPNHKHTEKLHKNKRKTVCIRDELEAENNTKAIPNNTVLYQPTVVNMIPLRNVQQRDLWPIKNVIHVPNF